MTITYSTNLGLELPGTGDQAGTWGITTNTNLGTLIEQAISGYVTQAVTDSGTATTLTIPNGASGVARNMYIELTGALTAARTVEVPSNKKLYFIYNNTTGGYAVTVKVSGQTGVSVANGAKVLLVSNGTDIVAATSYTTSSTPGGSNTQVQYNSSGSLAGSANFTFDGSNVTVSGNTTSAAFVPTGSTVPANGIYRSATNTLAFSSNTTARGTINSTGNWAVNAPSSGQALTVNAATNGATNGGIVLNGSGNTPPIAVTFSATAMTVDCTKSNVFTTTFTANVTTAPTISNPQDGQTINWLITQDSTGSRTMTWPTSFKWPSGTAGVLSTAANSVDLLIALYSSSTGFWYATLQKGFA